MAELLQLGRLVRRDAEHVQPGAAEVTESGAIAKANPIGTVLAWILFLIVVAGIVLGVTWVVATGFGKVMDFSHIYPTIHSK